MAKVKAYYGKVKRPTIWDFDTVEKAKKFSKQIKHTGWKKIKITK